MLPPGTLLQQRYRVVRSLKQGGMGTVYEAHDERLDSTVALKECHFTEEPLRKQFEREARLLARLRHPALTKVIDHFAEASGQFLVMEFIPGSDLAEMILERNAPFPQAEVLVWADQLLDALDYLHTHEPPVVHRDIKPQNLKLAARNQIILLDFGLAKGFADHRSRITSSGSIFGYTPNYAPLEQIQGTGTDPRSDLYSLAATLFHLLTATAPPDALTRITAVANDQPDSLASARDLNPLVTPAVSDILEQAMSQNRGRRPASAALMRQMLRDAARDAPQPSDARAATIVEQRHVIPAPPHPDPPAPREPTQPQPQDIPPTRPEPRVPPTDGGANARTNDTAARGTRFTEQRRADTVQQFLETYAEPERASGGGFKVWWLAVPAVVMLFVVAGAFYLLTSTKRPTKIDVDVQTPAQSNAPSTINSAVAQKGNPLAAPQMNSNTAASQTKPTPLAKPTQAAVAASEDKPPAVAEKSAAPAPSKTISAGILNGKAISKPQPPYPAIAKAALASGTVTVQVLVDESGRVVSAAPLTGHPLLQQAAVGAARQARFSPTTLSGQPVKVSGVLTYNFVLQ